MVDETTDSSNTEQVVLVIRWVDGQLIVHEEFIGLYSLPAIDADTLTSVIKDSLVRLNLSLNKMHGQCYDGASSMSGAKTGVAKQISDIESRAIFTHCYGHTLNLACSDTVKGCKILRDTLETTREITKLIKFSPKREAIFQEIKKDILIHADLETPGIRLLYVQLAGLCVEIVFVVFAITILFLLIPLKEVGRSQPTLRQKVD